MLDYIKQYITNLDNKIESFLGSIKNEEKKRKEDLNDESIFLQCLYDFPTQDEKIGDELHVILHEEYKSAVLPNFIGLIVDFFDENTKDGKITGTKQGETGDCWLLSGINALSYSEAGREILKECLEYHDGYTLVHLKACGTIRVDDDEVIRTKGSLQYSKGDDDTIILELAVQKLLDDIANGNSVYAEDFLFSITGSPEKETRWKKPSIHSNYATPHLILHFITGKKPRMIINADEIKTKLKSLEVNPNQAIAIATSDKIKIKDIDGKTIKLAGKHAYAVKSIEGDIVTITNPWNSNKEIKVNIETLAENIQGIFCVNLENDEQEINSISRAYKLDSDGNKVFLFQNPYREIKEIRNPKKNKEIESREEKYYNPETNKLEKITRYSYYKKKENVTQKTEEYYNPQTGQIEKIEIWNYTEENTVSRKYIKTYDPELNCFVVEEYDKNGSLIITSTEEIEN